MRQVRSSAGVVVWDFSHKYAGTMISQLVFRNGLKVGNNAHQTMSRIRLLHAGLRKYLNMQNHNREEVPINQEDLAITLCLFCYCNIRSLFRMGVYLFRREVDAFGN